MKKSLKIFKIIILIASIGLGIVYIAPLFMSPQFEIVNRTPHEVFVTAHWREKSKEIGTMKPSSTHKFSVKDEAGMTFKARYPDGHEITSEGIYFTGGTTVEAMITETGIEVKYDFESFEKKKGSDWNRF